MKIRNKEYQSLEMEQLRELTDDFPNDLKLGEFIRSLTLNATDNNPKGTSVHEPQIPSQIDNEEDKIDHYPPLMTPHWRTFTSF